jgi:hypothetical protein
MNDAQVVRVCSGLTAMHATAEVRLQNRALMQKSWPKLRFDGACALR